MQMVASLSMYFNFIYMLMLFCVAFYGIVSNTIHNHKSCCYSSNG